MRGCVPVCMSHLKLCVFVGLSGSLFFYANRNVISSCPLSYITGAKWIGTFHAKHLCQCLRPGREHPKVTTYSIVEEKGVDRLIRLCSLPVYIHK